MRTFQCGFGQRELLRHTRVTEQRIDFGQKIYKMTSSPNYSTLPHSRFIHAAQSSFDGHDEHGDKFAIQRREAHVDEERRGAVDHDERVVEIADQMPDRRAHDLHHVVLQAVQRCRQCVAQDEY